MTIERTDHDAAGHVDQVEASDHSRSHHDRCVHCLVFRAGRRGHAVQFRGFDGIRMILLPAVAALICGCVYMLLVAKVGKFGAISVMGIVVGLFLFVSGHFILSLAASIVFPVIADAIARAGDYRSKTGILASYVVFCYGLTGPILPLWFMKDAYVASLQARGKDSSYIDGVFAYVNTGTFFIAMIVVLVCALLGGWFGQRMLKKHFAKTGII